MTADEQRWQSEADVRTLQAYAEIQSDPVRMAAAKKVIEAQAAALDAFLEGFSGDNRL